MSEEQIRELLQDVENYGLEFKRARDSFSMITLMDYCTAIANEHGGYLLLGVSNDRKILGTRAFGAEWNTLAHKLNQVLGIRVQVYKVKTSDGPVLTFRIPKHFTGVPVKTHKKSQYTYPIRDGESLVEMSQDTLRQIMNEQEQDWSAEISTGVGYEDLDESALRVYRGAWAKYSRQPTRNSTNLQTMLHDLGLMIDGRVTNAALLLFGTPQVLARKIPDAEIIFEWRNKVTDIPYGIRENWRAGFMIIQDELWKAVNARNTVFRYQSGFAQKEIQAFSEDSVREAIVNAFTHRDYTIKGRSIVIKANPEEFYIENPGRLMPGVTLENIIDKSVWRNRLLAESLEKVHVMERSSQGVDKIFTQTIKAGKGIPKYAITNDPSVSLSIPARLADQDFIGFLEQVSPKEEDGLSIKEIIELEQIRQGIKNKGSELQYKDRLLELGIIERVGRGRAASYILSHHYYKYRGDRGTHTRLTGLTRDVKASIILKHLKKNGRITNAELQDAMPDMEMTEIYSLLKSMSKQGVIEHRGSKRYGYWVEANGPNEQLNLLDAD